MQLENLKLRENKTFRYAGIVRMVNTVIIINLRSNSPFLNFRIEEIPCDEINLAGEEQLAPVVQYFKTTTYPIAIPLLIKVKDVSMQLIYLNEKVGFILCCAEIQRNKLMGKKMYEVKQNKHKK